MIKLNIHEAKTHLSHYLEEVEQGETILLCKRNKPVAEIRPLPGHRHKKRPIGLAKGKFSIPSTFFDELPDEMSASFNGDA
jgi:prevent-host-death family protein